MLVERYVTRETRDSRAFEYEYVFRGQKLVLDNQDMERNLFKAGLCRVNGKN